MPAAIPPRVDEPARTVDERRLSQYGTRFLDEVRPRVNEVLPPTSAGLREIRTENAQLSGAAGVALFLFTQQESGRALGNIGKLEVVCACSLVQYPG